MTVAPVVSALPQRILGKTGEQVPILGLGTAPGGFGLEDAAAIELIEMAIDRGVTYLDTAPGYERAQSQLGNIVPRRRDEIFLVTKVLTSDGKEAVEKLEENLRVLQTDAVDVCYVHSLGHLDVDQVLAKDGSLAGLRDAQKRGLTRYVGFTAHHKPAWSERVLREADVDVAMFALNFADHQTYGFDRTVLPAALAQNTGIAAMKVFGGAKDMEYHTTAEERDRPSALRVVDPAFDHEQSLRWSLGLEGVSLAVIGMYSPQELERNIEWVRRFQPLAPAENRTLLDSGRDFASAWGEHYGDVE